MRQLSHAVRMLARTPFVTAVAALSLGLGIGANTAVFSLFQRILMEPLPVEAPEALVNLGAPGPKSGSQSCNNSGGCEEVFSYPMFLDLSRMQDVFTGIAAHCTFSASVGFEGETLVVDASEVSGSYFGLLGLAPASGRLIAPADAETPGDAPVVVLSYDYWMTRFGGRQDIVGNTLVVNGRTLTVIGVGPSGFEGTTRGVKIRLFVPITLKGLVEPPFSGFDDRSDYWAYLFARLRPGVSIEAARIGVNLPYARILTDVELPLQSSSWTDDDRAQFVARQVTVEDGRRGQSSILARAATPLTVLQAVTIVVLLIACANIANLLLVRAAGRTGEIAIRLSLGASRAQVIGQLLVESLVLATIGGIAGLVILGWMVHFITMGLPFGYVDPSVSTIDVGLLAFAAALSGATGVLFGLFPALHATRPDLASALKGQAGQPSGARSAARFRSSLVMVQIALSMGLLTVAGFFAKSLLNISRVDLGVEVDHVVTFRLSPQQNGYTPERTRQFFEEVLDRLATLPGVTSVAAARVALIANSSSSTRITVEGVEDDGQRTSPNVNDVSPGYFQTFGVRLLAGRDFTDQDVAGAPKVAIVNETFARRYGIGPNPVGHRLRRGGSESDPFDIEIVGLVADAKYARVRDDVPPVFFLPFRQNERIGSLAFYARTAGPLDPLVAGIQPLVASLDPNLPVTRLSTMPDQIANNVSRDRMLSVLSATFAGLATALAALGLYGVLAYTVTQRTREFGLRMALGASPATLQHLVLRQVVWLTLAGGTVGLGLALATGHAARAMFFDMTAWDPMVLVLSIVTLVGVALTAGYLPSRRASRVDPMRALRWE